ncbi:MAG TPA: tetratricopeptide repeat protein [Spirochaetota bacterium]|nr:tetratricopeptide repeat protein [Spirochaetota bacterium]
MANKKSGRNIEIKRNVIERYIMTVKEFVRENRKKVKYVTIAVLSVIAILIAVDFVYGHIASKERGRLDAIMDTYKAGSANPETVAKCREDLILLVKEAKTGHVKDMSTFLLASILFDEKKYQESMEYYLAFAGESSSDTLFVPLAVNKAAVCLEEMGKYDQAITLISKYSENKDFMVVMDQMMYNTGRLYALKGDNAKAREFFNQVRNDYPQSPYADKAKERLFLLSMPK